MKRIIQFTVLITIVSVLHSKITYSQFDFRNYTYINQEIKNLFRLINNNNRAVSYKSKIQINFPTGEVDSIQTLHAYDLDSMYTYHKNNLEESFVSQSWYFKIDHIAQGISYFNIEKYNQRYPQWSMDIDDYFSGTTNEAFLDSTVFKFGKIEREEVSGQYRTYHITFPPNYFIKKYEIKVDISRGMPEYSLLEFMDPTVAYIHSFTFERSSYKVLYYDYSTSIPEGIFDINKYVKSYVDNNKFSKYEIYKI